MKHRNLNLQSRRKKNRDVLTDIYTVAPGTAGSSLRATYAAGELLDWIDVNSVEQEDVFRWIDENVPMENSAELARAWAAVLTEAEALMRGDETAYDALDDAGYTLWNSRTAARAG